MEKKVWDNEERRRYYGVRVGDTVKLYFMKNETFAEVVGYGFLDNNRVYIKIHGEEEEISWVAEHCDVIVKVEDKIKNV